MKSKITNDATVANSISSYLLAFPEERYKEYLSLMGAFTELGEVNDEMKALPYWKLDSFENYNGRKSVFIMAFGDYKDGLLSFEELASIVMFYIYRHYPEHDALNHRPEGKWKEDHIKERDELYEMLFLCMHLEDDKYLSTRHLSREKGMKMLTDYYETYKSWDYRVRKNIPENER